MLTFKIQYLLIFIYVFFPIKLTDLSKKENTYSKNDFYTIKPIHIIKLNSFYKSLNNLNNHFSQNKVRILQFGDSHTASDWLTGPLRKLLAGRFGDGGPGFVYAAKPWKWHYHNLVNYEVNSATNPISMIKEQIKPIRYFLNRYFEFDLLSFLPNTYHEHIENYRALRKASNRKYIFGIGGVHSYVNHSAVTIHLKSYINYLELWFTGKKNGPDILLSLNPFKREFKISSNSENRTVQREIIKSKYYFNKVTYKVDDKIGADLSGFILENKNSGIVLDRLGLDGSKISCLYNQDWDNELKKQIEWRDPQLIILAYGSNSALSSRFNKSLYEYQFTSIIKRIKEVSSSNILILSPPDLNLYDKSTGKYFTPQRLKDIIQLQKKIAVNENVSFINTFEIMGGESSIHSYFEKGLAQKDHVHLNKKGYEFLARKIYDIIISHYMNFLNQER